jgi:hypothetical protein
MYAKTVLSKIKGDYEKLKMDYSMAESRYHLAVKERLEMTSKIEKHLKRMEDLQKSAGVYDSIIKTIEDMIFDESGEIKEEDPEDV